MLWKLAEFFKLFGASSYECFLATSPYWTHVVAANKKKRLAAAKKAFRTELLSMGRAQKTKGRKKRVKKICVLVSIIHRRKTISSEWFIVGVWKKKFRQMIIGMFGYFHKWQCLHHMFYNGLHVLLCDYGAQEKFLPKGDLRCCWGKLLKCFINNMLIFSLGRS